LRTTASSPAHRTLKGFGKRVQYSVFECLLSEHDFSLLRERFQGLIDKAHPSDSIRYYLLCQNCVLDVQIDGNRDFRPDDDFFVS
jgi:CRISPR-associated protein Cas2